MSRVARPDPTSDEVSQYYQAHQDQINQPFDQAKENIAKTLKDQALQKGRLAYMQTLMQRAVNDNNLTVLISPPKVKIPVDPQRLKGDSKAPVTIVEFSDFSCPYCAKAELTVNELLAKYPGKVKVGYRDFPLRQLHPQAQLAAEASRCAGEQNKYWEYHDLLFANREKQDRSDLVGYASSLKLDSKQFETCLSTGRYKPQIEEDVRLGNAAGIISTPGFLVNGRFLGGARPLADFERIVNEELSKPPEK